MHTILGWISLKRDLLELWLLNGTIAVLSLSSIQTLLSISLIVLTGFYTAWKFRKEYNEDKKKKNEGKT